MSNDLNQNKPKGNKPLREISVEGCTILGVATSPNVKNWMRKPAGYFFKKKFFKMIDTLHPIPEV